MNLQISLLKHEARCALLKFRKLTEHLDCGNEMAKHISVEASIAARDFNEVMEVLAAADPNCPEWKRL